MNFRSMFSSEVAEKMWYIEIEYIHIYIKLFRCYSWFFIYFYLKKTEELNCEDFSKDHNLCWRFVLCKRFVLLVGLGCDSCCETFSSGITVPGALMPPSGLQGRTWFASSQGKQRWITAVWYLKGEACTLFDFF